MDQRTEGYQTHQRGLLIIEEILTDNFLDYIWQIHSHDPPSELSDKLPTYSLVRVLFTACRSVRTLRVLQLTRKSCDSFTASYVSTDHLVI